MHINNTDEIKKSINRLIDNTTNIENLSELSHDKLLSLFFKHKKIHDSIEKRPTKIAVDIDGVIADFVDQFLSQYNKKYNTSFTENDIADYGMSALRKNITPDPVKVIANDPDFYRTMKLLPTAERFKEFYNKYDVIIISAIDKRNGDARLEWLEKNFPDFPKENVYFTFDKFNSNIHFDYIIEDNPDTFDFDRTIAYMQSYNEDTIMKFDNIAVSSWDDIIDIVAPNLFTPKENT